MTERQEFLQNRLDALREGWVERCQAMAERLEWSGGPNTGLVSWLTSAVSSLVHDLEEYTRNQGRLLEIKRIEEDKDHEGQRATE